MSEYLIAIVFMTIFTVSVVAIFYATRNTRTINEDLRKIIADLLDVILRQSTGMERIGQSVIALRASTELKNPAAGPAIVGQAAKLDPLSKKPPVDIGLPKTLHGTTIKAGRG